MLMKMKLGCCEPLVAAAKVLWAMSNTDKAAYRRVIVFMVRLFLQVLSVIPSLAGFTG